LLDGRIEDEKVAVLRLMERFGYGPTHLFRYEIRFRHALESRDAFPTRMRENSIDERRDWTGFVVR